MPRLKIIDPATDSGPGADILNGPLKDKQINIFKGLAAHPKLFEAFLGWMKGVKAGALTEDEHETIALIVAEVNDCEYCTAAHTKIAEGAGIIEDQALAIRRGESDDPKRQALIDFTRAVLDTNGNVTDEQLDAFRSAGYDDKAVIEALAAITVVYFTNLYNHVNNTEVDFPVPAGV